jgi:hypothetical protein
MQSKSTKLRYETLVTTIVSGVINQIHTCRVLGQGHEIKKDTSMPIHQLVFKELKCYELVLFYQERINGCKGIIYGKALVEILS